MSCHLVYFPASLLLTALRTERGARLEGFDASFNCFFRAASSLSFWAHSAFRASRSALVSARDFSRFAVRRWENGRLLRKNSAGMAPLFAGRVFSMRSSRKSKARWLAACRGAMWAHSVAC
ncbi:hypothetical protein DX903_03130 [Adlercreutzia equolifaciens]|nr:hypothetical protein DX903_03130 [Adlercreutzia equolifaciens]